MTRLAAAEARDKLTEAIPLKRLGTIEEIGDLTVLLVSGAAEYIHGETVVADGGAWLGASARGIG